MDTGTIQKILFKSETGKACLHDAIWEACDVSHDDAALEIVFGMLPVR